MHVGYDPSKCSTLIAIACAGLVASSCGDGDRGPLEPATDAPATAAAGSGGPGLALYGTGKVKRRVPDPCPAPGHRDFDFWTGSWEVENTVTGEPLGTSVISSELGGCVVMEDIIATDGFRSRSLSAYDRATDTWYQSFLTGNTTNIRLSGGLEGPSMVMTASQPAFDVRDGRVKRRDHRVTWTPNPDGTVEQLVEPSFDGEPLPPGQLLYVPATSLEREEERFIPFCQASVIPGFRELDFWLGAWDVSATSGPSLGVSEVRTELSDCLLVEDFETPRGLQSRSYVFYDFVTATWHRTYVDENGEFVRLSGRLEGGAGSPRLVMTGRDVGPDGREFLLRVTIVPVGAEPTTPDAVRHVWETSHDEGATWQTALSLDYRPR